MRDRINRMEEPANDLGEVLAEVGRELGKALGDFAFAMAAQAAMGSMVQGEQEKVRVALQSLTAGQLGKVAAAARQLAEMAEEGQ